MMKNIDWDNPSTTKQMAEDFELKVKHHFMDADKPESNSELMKWFCKTFEKEEIVNWAFSIMGELNNAKKMAILMSELLKNKNSQP